MKVVLSFAVILCSVVLTNAGLLFTDSFNYADGALTNVANGIWHEDSGAGDILVTSGQVQLTSSSGQDAAAALTNQPFATGSGVTIYSSFTVKFIALPTTVGSYFAHLMQSASFRCLVWASINGADSGKFRLGIGNTTGASATSGQVAMDLDLNTIYQVVTRYVVGTGQSTIWINPTNEANASVSAGDSPTPISISNFGLRQAGNIGTILLDNLRIGTNFLDVVSTNGLPPEPPAVTAQPADQTVFAGDNVTFSVSANGTSPLSYQWNLNGFGTLPGETNASLTLLSVTTNLSGNTYFVSITNVAGATNSQNALLTVNPLPVLSSNTFTFLQYNVKGNFSTNWSTNAPQVISIGHEISYLKPDVITFNEIPNTMRSEMTNWAKDFLSGYDVRVSPGTDGSIRNAIASRFPVIRSTNYLDGINLEPFGYTNASPGLEIFTRDLFEAQIAVPGFPQPLHVFSAHLKSGTSSSDDAARRAAEASAVSNFFVTVFLTSTNYLHPYILAGDMNEDIEKPATGSRQPIQRMISPPTGLRLTTPVNPFTHSNFTHSIQGNLNNRYDYIMPNSLLFSNIVSSQVFRTDQLIAPPPPLVSNDDTNASDHLPVVMVFSNPYDKPFTISTFLRTNSSVTLAWNAIPGQSYRVEASSNLFNWSGLVSGLVATNYSFTFTTNNVSDSMQFFRVYRGW